jgi:hypothetical protein
MPRQYTSRDPLLRFEEKIQKSSEPNGCWIWTAALSDKGYGFFKSSDGRMMKAHRFAYETYVGPIPPRLLVLHTCDTPACVRPDHLWVGTHADNMADMARKKRAASGERNGAYTHPETRHFGTKNVNARLTEDDIRAIRREYLPIRGMLVALGRKYNTPPQNIHSIVIRKTWRHVTDP